MRLLAELVFGPLASWLIVGGFLAVVVLGGWIYARWEDRRDRMPDEWVRREIARQLRERDR